MNATLTSLSLARNNIGDAGATQLAACLRVNVTLKSLNLALTRIGDEGATQLAESLRVNATLMSLDLGHNPLISDATRHAVQAASWSHCCALGRQPSGP